MIVPFRLRVVDRPMESQKPPSFHATLAYYLKRISKGWIFRQFPGNWEAFLEKPDGTVELLKSYRTKPSLNEAATFVREESFRRYAINNDRWTTGFGGRL